MKRNNRLRGQLPTTQTAAAFSVEPPVPPTGYGWPTSPAPVGQAQSMRLIPVVTCDPAPYESAIDHDATMVWSATANGPAVQCGDIVNDAFESLACVALRFGADGLYSVRLSTSVDNGWMYATATATATLPRRVAPTPAPHTPGMAT